MEHKNINLEKNDNEKLNDAINHKNTSLRCLNNSFMKHINAKEYKKSHLLAYWVNDYSKYHDQEKTFDTTKLITFKRGHIIKVNLGFKIGSEFGGLHYCVVLDKFDNPKNKTLTVIPLTSKKENKNYPNSALDLKDEIYNTLNNLYIQEKKKIIDNYDDIWSLSAEKIKQFALDFEYIEKIKSDISKMKKGSIALINQITTISKQRIFDDDVLKKVRLSNESLNLIDEKIIRYFTK